MAPPRCEKRLKDREIEELKTTRLGIVKDTKGMRGMNKEEESKSLWKPVA